MQHTVFLHPLMLPDVETADSHVHGHGMDFLHPLMMHPQEEESLCNLFASAYDSSAGGGAGAAWV
jgi:hypothetical protein